MLPVLVREERCFITCDHQTPLAVQEHLAAVPAPPLAHRLLIMKQHDAASAFGERGSLHLQGCQEARLNTCAGWGILVKQRYCFRPSRPPSSMTITSVSGRRPFWSLHSRAAPISRGRRPSFKGGSRTFGCVAASPATFESSLDFISEHMMIWYVGSSSVK